MRLLSTVVCAFLITAAALAKDNNPADYPAIAHVISANGDTAGFTTDANIADSMQMQIGNLIYTTNRYCSRRVAVGSDVHARVDGRWIRLLTDSGQTCSAIIRGVHEVK